MRIGYIVDEFPSLTETFVLREMKALADRGFEIIPFTMVPGQAEFVHEEARRFLGRTVTRPGLGSAKSVAGCLRTFARVPLRYLTVASRHLCRSLGQDWPYCRLMGALWSAVAFTPPALDLGLDRIHAQFGSYTGLVGLLLHRLTRIPYSFSMHARDVFAEVSPFLREQIAEADFVTVCNEHAAQEVRRLAGPIGPGKVRVVHHGLDVGDFDARLSEAEGAPREAPPGVLSAGRLIPKKGFDVLLRACGRIREQGREFRLTIIGDGPERERLEQMAAELLPSESVYFLGRQPMRRVVEALAGSEVFALASVIAEDGDRDGLPNVILEAMAARLPVVASRVGGIPEAVTDGETGLLTEPGDHEALAGALARLLDDPDLRERCGQAGRKAVEQRFDVKKNVAKLAELLEQG